MSFRILLRTLHCTEPINMEVAAWLASDRTELPASVQGLPPEIRNEVELRLMRARAELRDEGAPSL